MLFGAFELKYFSKKFFYLSIFFLYKGPILGGTFGLVVQSRRVWRPAVLNELIGLSICLLCGKQIVVFFPGPSKISVILFLHHIPLFLSLN